MVSSPAKCRYRRSAVSHGRRYRYTDTSSRSVTITRQLMASGSKNQSAQRREGSLKTARLRRDSCKANRKATRTLWCVGQDFAIKNSRYGVAVFIGEMNLDITKRSDEPFGADFSSLGSNLH
jgi:hypothetical protein